MNDALDLSKIEVGVLRVEARPAFLRETLLEVITIMRSAYSVPRTRKTGDIRLRLKVAESVPQEEILADEVRVRQVNKSCMMLPTSSCLTHASAGHTRVCQENGGFV